MLDEKDEVIRFLKQEKDNKKRFIELELFKQKALFENLERTLYMKENFVENLFILKELKYFCYFNKTK